MFRHEYKYVINKLEEYELINRLSPIMKKDQHTKNNDYYTVRSMYFDDCNNTCLKDVINGISRRTKYRIRLYNHSNTYIALEKKSKINNLTKKESCIVTKKQVEDILNNNISIDDKNPKLLNELYTLILTKGYRPVIIIEYDRIPYVYENLVRVTIDRNITCSYDISSFFNKKNMSYSVTDDNTSILEIKYGSILPDVIKYGVQINSLYRTSYSKYSNARLITKDYIGGNL